MKKINITLGVIGAVALFSFSACEKEDDHHDEDHTTPVITLSQPTDLSVYNLRDTIWIKGKLEDNSLHEALIEIKDDTSSVVLFTYAPHVHEMTMYTIDTFWVGSVSKNTAATLNVSAADHGENKAVKQVKFKVNF